MVDVSVIIPAYNAEKTLYRCLQSITLNKFLSGKFEVLLIDNNSTDETRLIAEHFGVKYIIEKRQGRSFARNRGAIESQGNFLAFIDADVYIEEDWVEKMYSVVSQKTVGGAASSVIPADTDGQGTINKFRERSQKEATSGTFNILNIVADESPMINSAACMYRRKAFEFVDGFDVELERHEDIDFSRRVLYAGYVLVAEDFAKAFVSYHGHGWIDYFYRTFQESYLKTDYLRKWKMIDIPLDDDNENAGTMLHRSTSLKKIIFDRMQPILKLQKTLKILYGETLRNLLLTFRYISLYYFLRFINGMCRVAGRFAGILRENPYLEKIHLNVLPRDQRVYSFISKNKQEVETLGNIRFVILRESIYTVNIKRHDVITLKQMPFLIIWLKQTFFTKLMKFYVKRKKTIRFMTLYTWELHKKRVRKDTLKMIFILRKPREKAGVIFGN